MIPASYLFKQVYHQQWEDNAAVRPQHRFLAGLLTPIAAGIAAVRHRRPQRSERLLGGHVYD
jgi:hypothetical protein